MPKYKCINKDCLAYNVEVNLDRITVLFDKNLGKVIDSGTYCYLCDSNNREYIRDKDAGYTTTMLGSANICKK